MDSFDISILVTLLIATLAMGGFGSVLIYLLQKQIKGDEEVKAKYVDVVEKIEDNFEKEQVFIDKVNTTFDNFKERAQASDKQNTTIFQMTADEFGKMQARVTDVGNDIIKHTGKEDGRWESIDNYQKEIYRVACKLEDRILNRDVKKDYEGDIRKWNKK